MKNLRIIIPILLSCFLVISACKPNDEPIPTPEPPEKVFNADLINPTFLELQIFYDSGYNIINGSLGFHETDSLVDLSKLSNLTKITGELYINANVGLSSLEGLNNLQIVEGRVGICCNPNLNTLLPLNKLEVIGTELSIFETKLRNLEGLNNVKKIQRLVISNNHELLNINDLSNLDSLGHIIIIQNGGLANINGLSNLSYLSSINIWGNYSLLNIDGLENVPFIDGGISLSSNENLSDFCGIRNMLIQSEYSGVYNVYENKYNPTVEDIIEGRCKQ